MPIVGHAVLFFEWKDDKGNIVWYKTEFDGKTPLDATVQLTQVTYDYIEEYTKDKLCSVKCLAGDYSKAKDYAERSKGTNYGGYNLFTNNCLHFVHDTLNYAKYGENVFFYDTMNTIIPALYEPTPQNPLPLIGRILTFPTFANITYPKHLIKILPKILKNRLIFC